MKKDIINSQSANIIRTAKKFANKILTHSEALEILSNLYGFENYNTFSAWLKNNPDMGEKLTTEINSKIVPLFTQKVLEKKKYLKKPLSKKVIIAKIKNEDFSIQETIAVDFDDLINWDIEVLNDNADDMILGESRYNLVTDPDDYPLSVTLSDLRYTVVGHIAGKGYDSGKVLIEINAAMDIN